MKHTYILFILFLAFASCNRDDSTGITRPVSEITIEDETEELNVDLGFELVCKVPVSQTMPNLPLTYEWATAAYISETLSDTLKIIGEEEELHYVFRQRGKHRLRLKVSNEHEAVFKDYVVWVNAAFETGIMMLAENENGDGNLSFLKTLTSEEIEAGVKEEILEHCFSAVNPGVDMKNPVGLVKISGVSYPWMSVSPTFMLATSDKIYFANPSSLEIMGTTSIDGEYAGEKIRTFVATDYWGFSPFILTDKGRAVHIEKKYYFLFTNTLNWVADVNDGLYEDIIVQPGIASGYAGIEPNLFFVDYANSVLNIYNNYAGKIPSNDLFEDERIITVYRENKQPAISKMYSISSSKENARQISIRELVTEENVLTGASKYTYDLAPGDKYPAQGTRLVGCATYAMALWHEGSEIYAWNYLNPEPKLPSMPVIDVRNADNAGSNMEITYMATSYLSFRNVDKWLYVGVYDKDTKRGGLYIYECSKIGEPGLKPYKQFDNQTDRIKFIMDKTR